MSRTVEAALRRHRLISLLALAALCALAWAWLLSGAGMDMPGADGTAMAGMDMASEPAWSPGRIALTFAMWWTMMVAMMLPSAAPTVLLYSRAARQQTVARVASEAFLFGYLAVWAAFSLLATALQMGLDQARLLASTAMAIDPRWLRGGVLIAVGLYQLSPFKDACLRHCRGPAQFLARHYRPGGAAALRMGTIHGAWCVGCCWLLMALLLVGGVMNLAWIAGLTLLVAAEKLLPFGRWVARGAGIAALAAGIAVLVLPQ